MAGDRGRARQYGSECEGNVVILALVQTFGINALGNITQFSPHEPRKVPERFVALIPKVCTRALLFASGLEPKRTEEFVGRLLGGNYILKALAKLDSMLSRWS